MMLREDRLPAHTGWIRRLARDNSGNVLAIIGAAILPLLALIGGGVDMGRGYLVQARLQQACDAGVLAARKRLGSETVVTGNIPDDTAVIGERFFHTNFKNNLYGTSTREFEMTLENDYAITGVATARMPTRIMSIFGMNHIDVAANCSAQLNSTNTDVMMVLDVTGSMAITNPGDSQSRMESLKSVIKDFHTQLQATAITGTRIATALCPIRPTSMSGICWKTIGSPMNGAIPRAGC